MKETFRDVIGFEGRYKVSNLGNVMSLNYQNTGRQKLLTPIKHHLGYLFVHLGKDKIKMIHVMVAESFIPNPEGKKFVNHIDGNKSNNVLTNLEWVTTKENVAHAIRTGLRDDPHNIRKLFGKDHYSSKPVLQFAKDGTFIKRWNCCSDAARFLDCNPCMIVNNAAGRSKSCHGYVFKYPNEKETSLSS